MTESQPSRAVLRQRALVGVYVRHSIPASSRTVTPEVLDDPLASAALAAVHRAEAAGQPMTPQAVIAQFVAAGDHRTYGVEGCRSILESPLLTQISPAHLPAIEEAVLQEREVPSPVPITPSNIEASVGHDETAIPNRQNRQNLQNPISNDGGSSIPNRQNRQNLQNSGHRIPSPLPTDETDKTDETPALGHWEGEGDYPIEALPEVARQMTLASSAAVAVPTSMTGSVALGVLSSALGAGLRIRTHSGDTGANLYLLVAAQSGTGKDQSLRHILAPLAELDRDAEREFDQEIAPKLRARRIILERARSAKGSDAPEEIELERIERDLAEIDERLAARPQFFANDATSEALSALMAIQPGEAIASITSEARHVFGLVGGRYRDGKTGDESFYTSSFSGSPIRVNRRGAAPYRLDSPCLSCLWLGQPDVLRDALANPTLIDSGLLPRFLFFDPSAEPPIIPRGGLPPIPPAAMMAWRNVIRELVETYRAGGDAPKTVELSEEAADLLLDFANQTAITRSSTGELHDIAPFVARWGEIAYRVALCLHAAEHGGRAHEHRLAERTAKAALLLMRWHCAEILTLLVEMRSAKHRDKDRRLFDLLADAGGEMTMRRLKKNHGYSEGCIIDAAKRTGKIELVELRPEGGGRPSKVARLVES